MTANRIPHPLTSTVRRVRLALLVCAMPFSVWGTEVSVDTSIEASYTHVADAEVGAFNVDSHNASTIKPQLQLTSRGPVWNGLWNVEHTQVQQSESGIDDTSFTDVRLSNRFSWWKGRVGFSLNGSRIHQNIDDEFSGVTDPIFGQGEYLDVDTVTSTLSLQNSVRSDWQNSLSLRFNEVKFDESELEDTGATTSRILNGQTLGANLAVQRGRRNEGSWFSLQVDGQRVDRDNRGEQESMTGQFNIGLPLYRDFDLVFNGVRAEHKVNSNVLEDSGFDSQSYGAGISWQLGANSFFEVSQNKSTRGQEDEFVGVRLQLQTGRHSSLYFQQSRRFYGESNAFRFAQRGKRWDFSINYDESLESQTRLLRSEVPNGFFLCSLGAGSVADCELFATQPEEAEGQFTVAITRVEFGLDEEITLRKSAGASFNYQFRRSQLGLTYARGESEFLERDEVRETETMSFNFNHKMNRRNTLVLTGAKSSSQSKSNSQSRRGFRVGLEFQRRLTRQATGSISIRRLSDTSDTGRQNRKDNRVELSYRYQF